MILLDTNVVSEPLRHTPERRVIEWLDAQSMDTLFLSTMSVAELRAGAALLPVGKRRTRLQETLEGHVLPSFLGRVLPFDLACTSEYAEILAKLRKRGSGITTADACIAAVAIANRLSIATRDTSPFLAAGVSVIDPWAA